MNPKSLFLWRRKKSQETSTVSVGRKDDESIRSYLLGVLTQTRAEQLEERMLRDDAFAERVLVIEDELVEDFARGALSASEKKQFRKHFLSTPRRRRKLMLVRALRKQSFEMGTTSERPVVPTAWWRHALLTPQFKAATLALLVLVVSAGVWRFYIYRSPLDRGLAALNEAFATERPLQSRVTGLGYAGWSPTRGNQSATNQSALDRSAAYLRIALDDDPSVQTHHAVGRLYLLQREFDKAVTEFEEALKTSPDNPRLHSDLGAALLEKGKIELADDKSTQGQTTLARSHDHFNEALRLDDSLLDARFNRALLYETLHLIPQALADWEKYLSLDPNSAWATEARAHVENLQKQTKTASTREADLFNQFMNAQQAGDDDKVWQVFSRGHLRNGNAITNTLIEKYLAAATEGHRDEAEQWSQTLLRLGQLSKERSGDNFTSDVAQAYNRATRERLSRLQEARRLVKLAYAEYEQSRNDRAIQYYQQARTLFEQLGDDAEALFAGFWMAFCYIQRSDTQSGLSILNQLETQCADRHYKWLSGMTQNGLANFYSRSARHSQAVAASWKSYEVSTQIADENGTLRALNTLSSLYRNLGNYRQSLRLAQKGLEFGNSISADDSQMIGFYATSAWSFNSLGHPSLALEYEKQALALAEKMNNPLTLSRYRVQMGLIQGMLRNYDEAITNIKSGIEIAQKLGQEKLGLEIVAYSKLYLARAYRNTQQFDAALLELNDVEAFSRRNDQLWILHEMQKEQLLTSIAKGETQIARQALAQVLDSYKENREAIHEESNRNTFFDNEQGIYDVAIDFAMTALGDPLEGFSYSEMSRARSRLDTFKTGWSVQDNAQGPDLKFSNVVEPMPLDRVKEKLPDQIQLLQFALLKDKLIIWYVTKHEFQSKKVDVGSDELAARVDQLLNLVSRPPRNNDQQPLKPATELYNLLIEPVAQLLDREKQLCIVPDKALNLLPFDVLFSASTQRFLIEDFALIYASSANTFVLDTKLAAEKNHNQRESLLAIGNPRFDRGKFPNLDDLPSAAREVSGIKGFYHPATLLNGPEATKVRVQTSLSNADVLHFATHYVVDANSPLLSRLILAGGKQESDAVLYAHEIYRLKPLKSRLAILAGCQTGVEGYLSAEGAMGLARPFKAAGVPVVIATLWPVDSNATSDLMIDFHRLRNDETRASAEALRLAQVQMLKLHPNPAYHHPYYWAAFVQTGGFSDY